MKSPDQSTNGYERSDWDLRWVVGAALSLVIGAVVVFLFGWWIFTWFRSSDIHRRGQQFPISEPVHLPPQPRLQVAPVEDLSEMLKSEQRDLATYGWIDKGQGIVRIPIDRAMQIVVQRGLPVRLQKETAK